MTIKLAIVILTLFGVVGAALGVTKRAGFFGGSTLGLAGLILFCMLPDGERVAAAGPGHQPKAWWKSEAAS